MPRFAQLTFLFLPLLLATPSLATAGEAGAQTIQLLSERKYGDLEIHLNKLRHEGRLAGTWTTALEAELDGMTAAVRDPKSLIGFTNEWCRQSPRSAWPFLVRAELAMSQAWIERRQRRSRTRSEKGSYPAETWNTHRA